MSYREGFNYLLSEMNKIKAHPYSNSFAIPEFRAFERSKNNIELYLYEAKKLLKEEYENQKRGHTIGGWSWLP